MSLYISRSRNQTFLFLILILLTSFGLLVVSFTFLYKIIVNFLQIDKILPYLYINCFLLIVDYLIMEYTNSPYFQNAFFLKEFLNRKFTAT